MQRDNMKGFHHTSVPSTQMRTFPFHYHCTLAKPNHILSHWGSALSVYSSHPYRHMCAQRPRHPWFSIPLQIPTENPCQENRPSHLFALLSNTDFLQSTTFFQPRNCSPHGRTCAKPFLQKSCSGFLRPFPNNRHRHLKKYCFCCRKRFLTGP